MVTSRDFQEIVSKVSSDYVRVREEGIKLLNTWLEGERSIGFCNFLGKNTAKLKPDDILSSETWPFLVKLLVKCVSSEISLSKRRAPKLIFAKTLRIVVHRAEETKFSEKILPLLSVVKTLFGHIYDVLSTVPSFQSEYGVMLRHVLTVRGYRFHMRKHIYSSLMVLCIEKVETSLREKNSSQYIQKDEVFRWILTLQSLLENPPRDFPDDLREKIVKGFIQIFYYVRDEGKVSRKLIECLNTYLLKDGPNLGSQSLEIHNAVQQFVFRCWLTTHDKGLKDALYFYARLQLNLIRGADDGSSLVEQLFDVICKELDQSNLSISGAPWSDAIKDDKFGTLSSLQCGMVELAALVFYRACVDTTKVPFTEKRVRKDNAAVHLKEALMKGKCLWNAAFFHLIHKYYSRIRQDLFVDWFDAICGSFDRILNDANVGHAYDGLLWTLRSLQGLFSKMLVPESQEEISSMSSFVSKEFSGGWQLIWSHLLNWLPTFSNVTPVVDAALVLLGSIISTGLMNTYIVPQDVSDLRLFKGMSSPSILYFITCYYSQKGSQGDLRDILHLRKNLLRAVLSSLNRKVSLMLNERVVLFLPAAVYALSTGCEPFRHCYKEIPLSQSFVDVSEAADDRIKTDEYNHERQLDLFECSVEVLAEIDSGLNIEVSPSRIYQRVSLPQQLREPLLNETEACILGFLGDLETEKCPLPDAFFICALLSNFIYGSLVTRRREETSSFLSKLGQYLLELLSHAVNIIEEKHNNFQSLSFMGFSSNFSEKSTILASFRSFVSCPLFIYCRDQDTMGFVHFNSVIQSMERLLKAIAKLYDDYNECVVNLQSETISSQLSTPDSPVKILNPLDSNKSRIVDMELDVNEDVKDVDILTAHGKAAAGVSFSAVKWKLGMISLISSFFSVLHVVTWDVLFDLTEKEHDLKVRENILYNLFQHPHWSSYAKLIDLVNLMNNGKEMQVSQKHDCVNILAAICSLLDTLLSLDTGKDKHCDLSLKEREAKKCLLCLGELLNKVMEFDLVDWFGRVKLIGCICNFILLSPEIGQTMIGKLLSMLHDPEYRVRVFLGRQIGVLFHTWDGHMELFLDICSNFDVDLVLYSKEKLVAAKEVLVAGPQPRPKVETVIITLMHLALHSEKIELEAVFMLCVVSAIDPCQRELVNTALDSLSRKLRYMSRMKYLEELIGSILFGWVACGVSIAALVEIRQLFVEDAEPSCFLQYCSHWLLPALVLQEDNPNLNWVAKISGQSLDVMVKDHFVPIFSVCMALHRSQASGWEKGAMVLQNSILHLAKISENERDELIKKQMVSIVSHILSLASSASDPTIPFFSRDTVAHAIQTVVDGFLELEDHPAIVSIIDKINILRPDRVFMFMVEMHYKIAAAIHPRHKCHRLASVEVLVSILGHRAAVPSTSNYLFNLIGQFIGSNALQDQCCRIISASLKSSNSNPSKEAIIVLGEQLQFLVSKLVECCNTSRADGKPSTSISSEVLSLLHQLTVDSDPSLHDYIRELEPFPEIDIFEGIRNFHQELCHMYSPKDHLLKFAKRCCYLPPRLLSCSLKALHRKLLLGETTQREINAGEFLDEICWHRDQDIVHAVWTLVHICAADDASWIRALVSDFISRVGIGDPYCVVFHLPGDSSHMHICGPINHEGAAEVKILVDTGISEELLIALLKVLKKYLMDDSVKIVDITSQTLQGILSTERGQKAMLSFDSVGRSLIEVHSKGVNCNLVEKLLMDLEKKFEADNISVEKATTWATNDKTFEMWICQLVYSLIGYCNDVILRLCQDLVLLKAEVAELLLPSVIVNLAGRNNLDVDIHKLISLQVEEHIFTESNKMTKSIQIFLNALNELRLCYVMERSSGPLRSSKNAKSSSYSSKSRSTPLKARNSAVALSEMAIFTCSWEKVYWLSIDYLLVAKSAIICGLYFSSVMYVEHWCEEHFNSLTLGSPDFSNFEMLPQHIEILISAINQINEPDSLYGVIQSHTIENFSPEQTQPTSHLSFSTLEGGTKWTPYKGLIRSLQQTGCTHVLDLYCNGLTSRKSQFQHDLEFTELQYEAAWRAGNWDFSSLYSGAHSTPSGHHIKNHHFNENLHSCLKGLQEGDSYEFQKNSEIRKRNLFGLSLMQARKALISSTQQ